MKPIQNFSRRDFLKLTGLAAGGLILACNSSSQGDAEQGSDNQAGWDANLFVQLLADGTVYIVASRSEMGNGVRTSLPSVVADEMGADWSRVRIRQATGDAKYGDQNTDGSRSIRYLFEPMRKMGAAARTMLIAAAAKQWKLPVDECRAENHFVLHKDGKKIAFGELVELATLEPVPEEPTLMKPADFRYVGKFLPSVDAADYASGKATFGMDIRLPGMKFAVMARCPVPFGSLKQVDKTAALAVPGVEAVLEIPRIERAFGPLGGVAVVANSTWAALKGRQALKLEWDFGPNAKHNSTEYMQQITANVHKPGKLDKERGDVEKAFAKAHRIVESTYQLPFLAHAPMETPNATVWVQDDSCEAWAPTQEPQATRKELIEFLRTTEEKVRVNVTLLGGGFGRKSKPDYVVEAAAVSKAIGAPVQMVWSREDDIRHGYYHTTSAQYLKAALDASGKVTAWLHRFALPSIGSTFTPGTDYAAGWEASSASGVPFDIENLRVEIGQAPAYVRIGWMRSVINIPHGLAISAFADELAAAASRDSLEYRLALIGADRTEDVGDGIVFSTARLKHVLQQVAKNAEWGKTLPEGHAYGLAVHYSFYSYVASVVEISMPNNKLKVHRIFTVIDCGTVVNRDTVMAQMEGSAIFGMSLAYYGKITAKDGAIEQSNYHDYRVLRMNEAPEIHVEIVDSNEPPTGVGEPAVPVVAPAILNAIFKLTGKRYYRLPLVDEGIV